ncbi:outer membrane beta-barrel family protein [Sinomicrobium soli]|uniref:outer membrane beta-barrel family protein n=1 Tax=Sinomicrobium sp. N-1-3-6 TaxID=2219864 RepID=UPI000DCB461B|nr:outer membrane beta-barrel family protein [Sinomicrobium sp. N-1-3-6]RAV28681.1 TonB-dependent receptor [Sinomicrobium sp. N-1-3-6]
MLIQKTLRICSWGLILFPGVILSQEYEVRGRVTETGGAALSFVNILLLQTSDSAVVAGSSSDENGDFILEGVRRGVYLLKVSSLGYADYVADLRVSGDTPVGKVILEENTESLEEVTVTGRQPLVQRQAGKLVFNVEHTVLSSRNSFDILRNTPGVLVINGEIRIRNTAADVYVNGKKVYLGGEELKAFLENYPGTHIRSVEVITSPQASYDADSGMVLNIVTSKNIVAGYKGGINAGWTQAVFPKFNLGTEHYFKSKVLDLFAGYNFAPSKEYKHDLDYINFFADGEMPSGRLETDFHRVTHSYVHNFHSIADLTLNKKNSLSISANIQHSPGTDYRNNAVTEIFEAGGTPGPYFLTDSDLDNDRSNLSFSLEYTYRLNDRDAVLKTLSNYIYHDDRQFQQLRTSYFDETGQHDSNSAFDFLARQRNNIFTQQVDISLPSASSVLETGVKYSSIQSRSRADFSGGGVPENTPDDRFNYYENIYAGYVNHTREWGEDISTVLGVRGEYTDVNARSVVLGEVNTRGYFELFPSVSLRYTPGEHHAFDLNYKRSLNRPSYGDLNPYRYYLNERQYEAGNPALTRAIEHKLALDYTYKRQYVFSLYYSGASGALRGLPYQDNAERVIYTSRYNIDREFQYSFDFSYYGNVFDWWYSYAYTSAFYMESRFNAIATDRLHNVNVTAFYGQVYNQFRLDEDGATNMELTLNYLSGMVSGSLKSKNQFSAGLGVTRTMWKNRLVASLSLEDIFNTSNIWYRSEYADQDNGYIARPETRKLILGLKYNFGNYRLKDNNRNTTPDEQERLGG